MTRTHEQVRRRLLSFINSLPQGSKTPFARVCGFADRRRLRAVARFDAYLGAGVASRLSSIMDRVESGDLMLVECQGQRAGRFQKLRWQWTASNGST